jgi:cytoskeletal protein CcmA (bactofilin family)
MDHGKEKGPLDPLEEKTIDLTASMQGTINFSDPVNLRIQGSFEGKLQAKGQLIVGEKAVKELPLPQEKGGVSR